MNQPVIDAILNRRSYRAYLDKPIPADVLRTVAETAAHAPSAMNKQPWQIVAVSDKQWLEKFDAEAVKNFVAANPDFDKTTKILKDAPAAIFVCAEEANPWSRADCGMLTQNICLTAEALGLGSCVIGMVRAVFEGPTAQEYLGQLGIEEGFTPLYAVVLGYPAAERPEARERDLTKITYK